MKRLLLLFILLLVLPVKVLAYGNLSCYAALNSNDETTLKPGDTITLNLGASSFNAEQYVSDAEYSFTYDPNIFEIVKNKDDSLFTVYNDWLTYKVGETKIDASTNKVYLFIGTMDKNDYFHDGGDTPVFAKIKLKVLDKAPDKYTSIVAFGDAESFYTSFKMDEDKNPTEIYDVKCSSKSISVSVKSPVKDKDTTLKSLRVTGVKLDPEFTPTNTRYSMSVESDVEKIFIAAICNGEKCSVSGNGTKTLKDGDNSFSIIVTAEDGSKRTYTINIKRAKGENQFAYLSDLVVEGHYMDSKFDSRKMTYRIKIATDVMTLKIFATCESEKCEIEGDGIVSLQENTTSVPVKVTTPDDEKTYTIIITREDSYVTSRIDSINDPDDDVKMPAIIWILFIGIILFLVYYFYKKSGFKINIKKQEDDKKKGNTTDTYNDWRYKK